MEIKGLSFIEVNERIAGGQVNEAVKVTHKTNQEIIKENVLTYFNLIFLILTILILVAGNYKLSSFTFIPIVVINIAVGIIQEIRAKKIVEKINLLAHPVAQVVREGQISEIDTAEIVMDDVIILRTGNQIPVDAELISGQVQVNEAILTGEADEITKKVGDILLSGSFIVSGECYAKVTSVGNQTYIAKIMIEAKTIDSEEQSQMIRSINNIVKWAGLLIIPIGMIMLYQGLVVNNLSFQASVQAMVAAVVGFIPEGLYLLTTVSLVSSTMRLAQQKVVLHDMKSVEKLARVDTLCIDKTGTITQAHMAVQDIIELKRPDDDSEAGVALKSLIAKVVHELEPDNETMKALHQAFPLGQLIQKEKIAVLPFSSLRKYSAVMYEGHAFVIGAPEILLNTDYPQYQAQIQAQAEKGLRVVLFGRTNADRVDQLTSPVSPYALIMLHNPIRDNAAETFTYFKEQDVTIKVISGDDPVTVSSVATQAGIENASQYIDARNLKMPSEIEVAAEKYTVFGRVTPEMKRKLIEAMQAKGHTVGMTGDGVNDVLALKSADCSIAMASGSEAAVQSAEVVLLESNFSSLPSIVEEGRRTVNNIERSASLFLVKNLFSLVISVLAVIFAVTYPMKPAQISLISGFMIGLPGYLLTLEPNNQRIKGSFLINVLSKSFAAALSAIVAIGLLVFSGQVFELEYNEVSTVATFILASILVLALIHVSRPLNRNKSYIIGLSILGFIVCALLFNNLFELRAPSFQVVVLGIIFFLVGESINRNLTLLIEFIAEAKWRQWFKFENK